MTALEQFVSQVQNLSAQEHYSQLADYVRKAISDVLAKNVAHLENVLSTFDLQQHSIGVLGVLYARTCALSNATDFEGAFAQLQEFFTNCNGDQVRFLPDIYCELCHRVAEILIGKHEPTRGISLISKAIERLQTTPAQLTLAHADLCMLCLKAKNFKPALKFLDVDIIDVAKEHCIAFDSKYFLSYYYYGGMIYAALKKFDRALHFFEVAVTTPAQAVSHIMIESYKKHILVSLILHGKVTQLPKYTSSVVGRFIKPVCQSYVELANVYAMNSPDALRDCVAKRAEIFNRDKNMGLVKQVVASIFKRSIQRLTKTFLTLSLFDVANRCRLHDPAEAEKYIVSMIEDGDIYATINQKDGMVHFHDSPEKYDTPRVVRMIETEIGGSVELSRLVKQLDLDILLNPKYVQKVVKSTAATFHEDEGVSVSANKECDL